MADQEESYVVVERSGGSFSAFLWGALLGGAAALLLAPGAGVETRKELKASWKRLRERADQALQEARDNVSDSVGDVRREVDAARHAFETGRAAGSSALHETRKDVERRVRETRADVERRVREASAAVKEDYRTRRSQPDASESGATSQDGPAADAGAEAE